MKNTETVEQFTKRVLAESIVDIDIEYCIANSVKFKNNEIDASKVELFNSKSNRAAYNFVMKKR